MRYLGEYICDTPPIGGKESSHSITNRIIPITMNPGNLLNGTVLYMDFKHSLVTLICLSISGTCSASMVMLRVDIPGNIHLII